jgi:hypothetical protein
MSADLAVWLLGASLEVLIFVRAWRGALLKKYPFFYGYLGCVFLAGVFLFSSYELNPKFYPTVYWYAELVTDMAGYTLIYEIFRQVLQHNPGVARAAQRLFLIVFIFALSYAVSDLLHSGFVPKPHSVAQLGRNLQYLRGALLLIMLWLLGRYRISLQRNLLGLTAGFSLMVGIDVVNLAFIFLPGHSDPVVLRKLYPITFVITLLIWCTTLWSASPEPAGPSESAIDRDYDLLAAKTMAAFDHLSARGGRALRP